MEKIKDNDEILLARTINTPDKEKFSMPNNRVTEPKGVNAAVVARL